jgi:hypothetical protein
VGVVVDAMDAIDEVAFASCAQQGTSSATRHPTKTLLVRGGVTL